MIYFKDVYASVFGVEDKETYIKARISTSRKDQNDNYVNSNWNAMFVGGSKEEAKTLTDKCRIKIKSGCVTNEPYTTAAGEKKYWVTVKVFDFEKLEHNKDSGNESAPEKSGKEKEKPPVVDEVDDDEVPF